LSAKNHKQGISLIAILAAILILLIGLIPLVKTAPIAEDISQRAKIALTFQTVSEKLLDTIERIYGEKGTMVPEKIAGSIPNSPEIDYIAFFKEEKEGFYTITLILSAPKEEKRYREEFYGSLLQK
jgi:uncharacterized membrane protein